MFDVLQAASFLGVSGQYVRRLLADGQRFAERVAASPEAEVAPPKKYLVGERSRGGSAGVPAAPGPVPWRINGAELMRFAESRQEKKFRPGYDLTLRPPKSVSVLWALGGPRIAADVREAHRAAVDAVVAYYEQHAVRARKPKSNRRVETDGMIAAAFDHRTSRAGDPLLHTHVVTANMTRFRDEEGNTVWRSVESSNLFEHAKAAGCLYQAHLRYELTKRLGVPFFPANNGHAEIDGIPAEVIDLFSKRRNEIEEELAATGRSSARSAQMATLETRKTKGRELRPSTRRQYRMLLEKFIYPTFGDERLDRGVRQHCANARRQRFGYPIPETHECHSERQCAQCAGGHWPPSFWTNTRRTAQKKHDGNDEGNGQGDITMQ